MSSLFENEAMEQFDEMIKLLGDEMVLRELLAEMDSDSLIDYAQSLAIAFDMD